MLGSRCIDAAEDDIGAPLVLLQRAVAKREQHSIVRDSGGKILESLGYLAQPESLASPRLPHGIESGKTLPIPLLC